MYRDYVGNDGQVFLVKKSIIFSHGGAFLVPDEPPLALPGSVLTPSTSARPGLERPTLDTTYSARFFAKKNVMFWTPSELLLLP